MVVVAVDQWARRAPGSDRGLGRYAKTLSSALQLCAGIDLIEIEPPSRGPRKQAGLELQLLRVGSNAALYHATSADHLPILKRTAWVCSIQDTIPVDISAYQRLGLKTRAHFLNAKRADGLVVNSRYTAERVSALLGVDPEKITVAPLPLDDFWFQSGANSNAESNLRPFVLSLVDTRTFDPRKRNHWIRDLLPELKTRDIELVIAGRGEIQDQFPGARTFRNPSDAELRCLYSNAECFFYPSAYEGQGLPPLEAMATGCPVVAFSNSAVNEMVQVPAFLLPDPVPWQDQRLDAALPKDSVREIIDRIEEVRSLKIYRHFALARAQEFTMGSFRGRLEQSYKSVLGDLL